MAADRGRPIPHYKAYLWTVSSLGLRLGDAAYASGRHRQPADITASHLDFAAWLSTLPTRYRRIAKRLATSESTGTVAKQFELSPARISQIRRELRDTWLEFQGEMPIVGQTAAA